MGIRETNNIKEMLRAKPHQQKLKSALKKRSMLHLFKKKKRNIYTTKHPMLTLEYDSLHLSIS
jgi:hypothetical protein